MEPIHMDEYKITAIDNKIRKKIMSHLIDRPYTITELSRILNLSVPTIKEHMEKLSKAGIVCVKESKRKWKYYTLTREGELITRSGKKSIPISVVLMFIITIGGLFILYTLYNFNLWNNTSNGQNPVQTPLQERAEGKVFETPMIIGGEGEYKDTRIEGSYAERSGSVIAETGEETGETFNETVNETENKNTNESA